MAIKWQVRTKTEDSQPIFFRLFWLLESTIRGRICIAWIYYHLVYVPFNNFIQKFQNSNLLQLLWSFLYRALKFYLKRNVLRFLKSSCVHIFFFIWFQKFLQNNNDWYFHRNKFLIIKSFSPQAHSSFSFSIKTTLRLLLYTPVSSFLYTLKPSMGYVGQ